MNRDLMLPIERMINNHVNYREIMLALCVVLIVLCALFYRRYLRISTGKTMLLLLAACIASVGLRDCNEISVATF